MFYFKFEAKYCLHYALAMIYVLSTVASTIYMVSGAVAPSSSFNKPNFDDWRITFYTGDKMWSGTDSMVYVQVHGEIDSQIFQLNPDKYQMEAHGIDSYTVQLPKIIRNIKAITVGKQHSYSFFNDWQLIKAELTDPNGKRFIFSCMCWLTTLRYKRTIELTAVDGIDVESGSSLDPYSSSSGRTTRVFPMTIGLLFLLLILIIFTYFGNVMCKKWKDNLFMTNSLRRRRSLNASNNESRAGQSRRLNPSHHVRNNTRRNHNNLYKDDDDEEENLELPARDGVYNFTSNLTDLNVNTSSSVNRNHRLPLSGRHMPQTLTINEDKPPEYTQLFPIKKEEEPTSVINTPNTKVSTAAEDSSETNQNASASPITTTVSSRNAVETNNITQL